MSKILLTQYSDRSNPVELYPYALTPEQEDLIEWLRERAMQSWEVKKIARMPLQPKSKGFKFSQEVNELVAKNNCLIQKQPEPTELEKASEEYRLRRHYSEQDEIRNSKDFIAGAKWLARKFMDNSVFDQDSIENDRSYCNAILDLRRRMRDLTKVRE